MSNVPETIDRCTCEKYRRVADEYKQRFKIWIRKRLPILQWLPKYNTQKLFYDFVTGISVGITIVLQGLSYATLAGLTPEHGLYSSYIGAFIYVIVGSCEYITIGPTSILSLMTFSYHKDGNFDFVVLLTLFTGLIQLATVIFQLGFLINFISVPVWLGFTWSATIVIVTVQLKFLLGLNFIPNTFLSSLQDFSKTMFHGRPWDSLLGFLSIVSLLILRKFQTSRLANKKSHIFRKTLAKIAWFLGLTRHIIVVLLGVIVAVSEYKRCRKPFLLTGRLKSGWPPFSVPRLSTKLHNKTLNFWEMSKEVGPSVAIVALVGIMETVTVVKKFLPAHRQTNAYQEILALGLANVLGSFAKAMPTSGAFISSATKSKTTMNGLFTGIIVLVSISCLAPYFYYVPQTSLAAMTICSVIFSIDIKALPKIWYSNKCDIVPFAVTFTSGLLFGIDYGLLIGIAVDLLKLLLSTIKPRIKVERRRFMSGSEYLIVQPKNNLYFPTANLLNKAINNIGMKDGYGCLPVAIDCKFVFKIDYTSARNVAVLLKNFNSRNQEVYLYNIENEVYDVLTRAMSTKNFRHLISQNQLSLILKEIRDTDSSYPNTSLDENLDRETEKIRSQPNFNVESIPRISVRDSEGSTIKITVTPADSTIERLKNRLYK